MKNSIANISGKFLETPFLLKQVETHLVFGPLSRHLQLGYIVLVWAIIHVGVTLFTFLRPLSLYIFEIILALPILIVPFIMLRMTCRQQAIFSLLVTKFSLGVAAGLMATVGASHSFSHGQADAWPNLLLGLIWIPSLELIPKITPNQKYITIARIILSIPCIYFGIKSGNWHWE